MTPQEQPDSQAGDELREGYDFSDFKEAYRKHHPLTEAPMPFIVELVAMQATVIAYQEAYAERLATERAVAELQDFKDYSYNLGFRGTGMEHLDERIAALRVGLHGDSK